MSIFWPKGIKVSDMQSPMQILETAQQEWEQSSDGILTLLLQGASSESGNDMIIVHAKHVHSKRIITLFSVIYRPNSHYPTTIQPKNDDLPNFLKKSYYQPKYQPSFAETKAHLIAKLDSDHSIRSVDKLSELEQIKNIWVSDSPPEFREKLEQVFNLSIVKSDILNLLSGFQEVTNKEGEELENEYVVEN